MAYGRRHKQLEVADFERVDTQAMRTLRRGGRVRYRYRTQIVGKGIEFSFASGGRSYREMVRHLFPLVHRRQARCARARVARLSLRSEGARHGSRGAEAGIDRCAGRSHAGLQARRQTKRGKAIRELDSTSVTASTVDNERASLLGAMGNRLRIAGRLNEAREAFRRALIVIPRDGRLIFDFARLLRSQATTLSDAKLLSRSRAALRLACNAR